jgi:hypothetical protein
VRLVAQNICSVILGPAKAGTRNPDGLATRTALDSGFARRRAPRNDRVEEEPTVIERGAVAGNLPTGIEVRAGSGPYETLA